MYRLSARQILMIAIISGLFAAGGVAIFDRVSNRFQSSHAALSETAPAGITDPAVATDEQNNIEVYKALSPGVVFIHSTSYSRDWLGFVEPQEGSGSGSVLDQQGNILTNYHVIEGAQKLSVSMGGQKDYAATVVGGDPDTDLAVIRLIEKPAGGLTVVPMGDSDKLVVGQKVLAIGNPFGLDRTLTTGVISGLQRPIRARNNRLIEGAIQTDASINPGNSGGPLLDSRGRMIGINSQILSTSGGSIGLGFAIPSNMARTVVEQLINSGRVRRGQLGVTALKIPSEEATRMGVTQGPGVVVYQVQSGSGADRAGLRAGDVITALNGEQVSEPNTFRNKIASTPPGTEITLTVKRDGREQQVRATLGEFTAPPERPRE